IHLKLAERSKNAKNVKVTTPVVGAPVLLAEWKVEPDTAQRLIYRDGTLTPVAGVSDNSGFSGLARIFGGDTERAIFALAAMLGLLALTLLTWRSAAAPSVAKFGFRYWFSIILGVVSIFMASVAFAGLLKLAGDHTTQPPRSL